MRFGIGYDVHPFEEGRKLVLAGIEIPYEKGLSGHSDADVLSHAICDAMLGAAGQEDIGVHFPDNDEKYKNISSLILIKKVKEIVEKKGFIINNIDTVIITQEPRLADYRARMRENLANALDIPQSRLNIKATTPERLGSFGRGEGMAVYAVVSLEGMELENNL
ncbi:MAG: 2-C-methyl-D-erythritol 2,4-cyclodiphosphate synthase [Candidatus Schekmanbacteria bacterium RIFCSPHIGHO2_02_FULL_38_11]|uniref:2-C-methyl-D-erythritol 2,4-cyclodiphosphate synthase n=1 Tax=Candidatus Schekmanbacteria bacterium RIFCSPLOWO2_12_FULL_38_15 TaxID=1817883 RepID=A0A1F7SHS6_9BACT|nr:MAG: 2-C-methyl-D-erythritol 2,4-cyclodiphosphate synthase [Candidatus Schekmanbacteria bacterium GWA2_38_9]OGL50898.1 MAG: 2-C-methyl-D-erythritol 2,4-cyclodiphosphate synthase [Candidatus Schekmanbacteria bacterium RIFCSPLOWO2_02_FULL_38_14]OGL53342.1 MAG: 2-C-methyl-D-erythritol 2,4-cyclodiphosphate synthase [Candidatus Schekmanbacteria bacterium RIFCSPLOWO2_12_FULL_38_15]OGL54773.1 MAG: 2-C-methyl-D-erythritol 2,4-cyclodiphosphate synthase [Candidatus Schekmanbacteria bacterium RIFCSPHIGH